MPRHSPYRIELNDEERAVLESLARSYTLPYWQVTRAQMVLMAAEGLSNAEIAGRLGVSRGRCRSGASASSTTAWMDLRTASRVDAGLFPPRYAPR